MSYSPEFGIPEMFSKYLWTWPALFRTVPLQHHYPAVQELHLDWQGRAGRLRE
jgi:hypothetical protein